MPIRIYKRGNDDINLDTYIRDAESEFDFWLANSRLKDNEKNLVREAYSKIILGLSDGSFTYKIGGGFNNSVGMSNQTEGFDAAGLAAGYLGNILRRLSVYTEEPDSFKIQYEGAKTIGSDILKSILGEAGNVLYFINLDLLINGKRGQTNRIKLLQDAIDDRANNWDKYFTGYNTNLKEQWFKDYAKYGKIDPNNNGVIDDNEYLGLSKLLGIDKIDRLFYTGNKITDDQQETSDNIGVYTDELAWRDIKYPNKNPSYKELSLKDPAIYGEWSRNALTNHLKKLNDLTLFKLINWAISTKGELYANPEIISYAGIGNNPVHFSNQYITDRMLNILLERGALNQYANSTGTLFYIPDSYDKDKGTGLIYDHVNKKLIKSNIYDIPWWTTKIHNEFVAQLPSHKQGGVLKKLAIGGYLDYTNPYTEADDIYNISLLDKYDENTRKGMFKGFRGSDHTLGAEAQLNDYSDKFTNNVASDIFTTSDAITALEKYKNSGNIIKDAQNYLKGKYTGTTYTTEELLELLNQYNEDVKKTREWQNLKLNWEYNTNNQTQNNVTHNSLYLSYGAYDEGLLDILGSATYARLALAFKDLDELKNQRSFKLDNFLDNIWIDNAGYLHIGEYGGQLPQLTNDELLATIDETNLPAVNTKINPLQSFLSDLTPTMIGAGRLWASLHTNNRVYDAILPSLLPVLKNTYERYSPVTGAFSAMLFKNNQGASILDRSNEPLTTDASLSSARMLEGLMNANQAQTEGFIADDTEIRRTKDEALKRVEDNMSRRNDVANFNRASINQANRERASLAATRLNKNWQSWDNFLRGIETDVRDRAYENRALSNKFREQISTNSALRWYDNVMEQANNELQNWMLAETKRTGETPDITEWPKYKQYVQRQKLAAEMVKDLQYKDVSNIYNIPYSPLYTDSAYDNFITWI